MIKPLGYGLIGCGMMGREHIRNIQLLKGATVTAIHEPDDMMRHAAEAIVPAAAQCQTIEDLVRREDVDCLVIASPNDMHMDQLQAISDIRALPILVEKPLATDRRQKQNVEMLRATYAAPIWVAMEYRYMPPIAALIAQADSATGGIDMLTIREHRFPFLPKVNDWNRFNARSGGTFVEKCCHFFDLMRLILRSEPVRVYASAGQAHNHLDERYDDRIPDIWDHGYVTLDFESGARAMLELSMFAEGSRFQEEISAVGGAGKIECFVPGPTRFWPNDLGPAPMSQLVVSPRDPKRPTTLDIPVDPALLEAGDHNGSTYYQHERFSRMVREGGEPEVSLADGWKAVDIGLAAQESVQTGQAIDMRNR